MTKITTGKVAKVLGVTKRTFLRWDKEGIIPFEREEISKTRLYNPFVIEKVKQWLDLRKKHKEHLKKLGPIRENLDQFITRKPLDPFNPPKLHRYEDMKKAFDDLHRWEKELKEIYKEYAEFTEGFYGKLEK